jgi:phosphoribosylanthranilate isomerase
MFEATPNETQVKICGITNTDDALACAAAGVDMIGLNFSRQSSRSVSPAKAAEIIATTRRTLAGIKLVGVFVNQECNFVENLARDLALDAVQLHGDESAQYISNLAALFTIKALRIGPQFAGSSAATFDCDAILLDAWSETASGGTGKTFAWPIAAAVRPFIKRLFLAGGLTAENVAGALRIVRPFAVDACSGVENSPGQKNHLKIQRFVEAVRAASDVPA